MWKLVQSTTTLPLRTQGRAIFLSATLLRKSAQSPESLLKEQRESEALSILAKHATVRARISPNLPKDLLGKPHGVEPFEIKSSLLRTILRKDGCTIRVVEERANPPVFAVEPVPTQPGGAAAEASSKSKQLRLRTNIDDHMMSIKVRQASEMTAKGNDVNITVRLPSKQLKQLISSAALSEEQKLAMQKKFYESSVQRFTEAFKGCSSKAPKLIPSKDFKEFTIILFANR